MEVNHPWHPHDRLALFGWALFIYITAHSYCLILSSYLYNKSLFDYKERNANHVPAYAIPLAPTF